MPSQRCDFGCLRYNEVGKAVFSLQLPELKQPGSQMTRWRLWSFHVEDDTHFKEVEEKRMDVRGMILQAGVAQCSIQHVSMSPHLHVSMLA